ncbi:MAG: hypothetical protein UT08_C0018G0031 [Candidatus Woesebacteria bacterium GW2011_GWB1_38_8]|uniref:SpoVT-AbrB domain-containing protein n=1 Tax=Candidatus Woesebacteria bacterium GW2011_GWB1_38_8 TaxID=1618570 RepID=A0A0G0L985_9BACT|nr:MAG: hypothetical protein UT08_C0018G0031 [Candidatus Woesebacteria bacterium GW2011_GWB1_38_8]
MTYTLTVSSQGQVVIPSHARKRLGLKPGSKIILSVETKGKIPKAILEPQPESWVSYVTGLGKGLWGKGEKYVEKERTSWESNE